MISKAIEASAALASRDLRVFPQGSYRNRTNVRTDSDVDICVLCKDSIFTSYAFAPGTKDSDVGLGEATYS